MLNIIFGILLAVSMIGYLNYLVNVKNIDLFLVPSLIITSITGLIYLAGILPLMPVMVAAIVIAGIVILIKTRKSIRLSFLKGNEFAITLCILLLGYLAYYTYSGLYSDGDSMTHWGIIVREMFNDNRLPNRTNTAIGYPSYPPATACWIYFFQKIFGYSEGKALFAQGLWMISCSISCFSLNKHKNKLADLLIGIFCFFSLFWLDGLRVDIIMPWVSVALGVIIYNYRDNIEMQATLSIPFALVIPMIKNSGLIFVLFDWLLLLCFLPKTESGNKKTAKNNPRKKTKKSSQNFVSMLSNSSSDKFTVRTAGLYYWGSVLAGWILWKLHISSVYDNAAYGRHSLSLPYMKAILFKKSPDDFKYIINTFFKNCFSFNNRSYEWIITILLVAVIILIFIKEKDLKSIKRFLITILICALLYKIGMLLMYFTNMPGKEGLDLAAYGRYQLSFTLLIMYSALGLFCTHIFTDNRIIPDKQHIIPIMGAILMTATLIIALPLNTYLRPDYKESGIHRRLVDLMKSDNGLGISEGNKVLEYDSYELAFFFVRFTFHNEDCNSTTDPEAIRETLSSNPENYDYVVISTYDDKINAVLKENGYSIPNPAPSVFCIKLSGN